MHVKEMKEKKEREKNYDLCISITEVDGYFYIFFTYDLSWNVILARSNPCSSTVTLGCFNYVELVTLD
jgi:hypothetical protein